MLIEPRSRQQASLCCAAAGCRRWTRYSCLDFKLPSSRPLLVVNGEFCDLFDTESVGPAQRKNQEAACAEKLQKLSRHCLRLGGEGQTIEAERQTCKELFKGIAIRTCSREKSEVLHQRSSGERTPWMMLKPKSLA